MPLFLPLVVVALGVQENVVVLWVMATGVVVLAVLQCGSSVNVLGLEKRPLSVP